MTDKELLVRLRGGGDPEAFSEVVRRNLSMAYSAAFRILADTHLAEDAAQAAFLALVKKAHALPHNMVLSGWIYNAAQLAARNMNRERQRRRRREEELAVIRATAESENMNETGCWEKLSSQIDEALSSLPAEQRNAIILRCLQQRSPAEVAKELGCTEKAALMRVNRGLERLRGKFRKRHINVSSALLFSTLSMYGLNSPSQKLFSVITELYLGKAATSGAAITHANGVLKAMLWNQIKTYASACLAFVLLGGVLLYTARAEDKVVVHSPQPNESKPRIAEPKGSTLNGLRLTLLSRKNE